MISGVGRDGGGASGCGAAGWSAGALGAFGAEIWGGGDCWAEAVVLAMAVVVMKRSIVVGDAEGDAEGVTGIAEDWRRVTWVVRVEAPVNVDVNPGLTKVCIVADGLPRSLGTSKSPESSVSSSPPLVPGKGPCGPSIEGGRFCCCFGGVCGASVGDRTLGYMYCSRYAPGSGCVGLMQIIFEWTSMRCWFSGTRMWMVLQESNRPCTAAMSRIQLPVDGMN
jgi:hypothetical protein